VKRAAAALGLALLGCDVSTTDGACEAAPWIAPGDPMAIAIRASGAVSWESGAGGDPITMSGTLASVEGDTLLRFDTAEGELEVQVDVARDRLGVLPIGAAVDVTLGDGVVLTGDEGRLVMAVISRRGSGDASAASVTVRQAYAECVRASCETEPCAASCYRVMASPLVDVVSGASIVRLPPGGVWRVPSDDDPSAEIEVVRSVRAPLPDELEGVPEPRCAELPADELAVIIRRLR
jgi:hypothetical protein